MMLLSGYAIGENRVAHIPKSENAEADALAKLASASIYTREVIVEDMTQPSIEDHKTLLVAQLDQDTPCWRDLIIGYLRNGTLRKDTREARALVRCSALYILEGPDLYRRSLTHPYQKCQG
ncbi:hypothetical protein ACLOJK_007044 [Asimina triloba]